MIRSMLSVLTITVRPVFTTADRLVGCSSAKQDRVSLLLTGEFAVEPLLWVEQVQNEDEKVQTLI